MRGGERRAKHEAIVAVGAILLLVGVMGGLATGAAMGQSTEPQTDTTHTEIKVHSNGTATWTVEIRTRLDSETELDAFRAFQSDFRENKSAYTSDFRTRIQNVVSSAENETGREMSVGEFSAETRVQQVPNRWGVVTYRFQWSGFAAVNESRIVVGDVFQGGFYLGQTDTLTITSPAEYKIASATPTADDALDRSVVWEESKDFDDTRPRVVFEPQAENESAGGDEETSGNQTPLMSGVAVVLVLALTGGGYYLFVRSSGDESGKDDEDNAELLEPLDGANGGGEGSEEADLELLADSEKVIHILDREGRVKQSQLVEELGWSASKTSRVVSDLESEGTIEKLRLGRENVLTLADEDE